MASTKKLTIEFIREYLESKNCKLISSEYCHSHQDMEILFSCGHIGLRSFNVFKRTKNICAKCSKSIYDNEDIKNFIIDNNFKFIDVGNICYKNRINIEDNMGYKYSISLYSFINQIMKEKRELVRFSINNPFTIENLRIFLNLNNIGLYLEDGQSWKGNHSKLSYRDIHGYMYCASFNGIMQIIRFGCFLAKFGRSNPYTIHNIENWIKINHKPFYLVDGQNFSGAFGKLKFKCLLCPDNEIPFESGLSAILNGVGCGICHNKQIGKYNNLKYNFPEISEEWDYDKNYPMTPDKVSPKTSSVFYWICPRCKKSYATQISSRTLCNSGCPICSESRVEKKIRKFLENNFISFVPQKRFDDCRDILPLPFDFYLDKYNILIEGQGIQHTKEIDFFGGKDGFIDRNKKDNIKKEYCKSRNIQLLEIYYYDYENIESILSKELNLNFSEHEISTERKEN